MGCARCGTLRCLESRRRGLARATACALLGLAGAASWAGDHAREDRDALEWAAFPCPHSPSVLVRTAVTHDAGLACDGAQRALAFLARHGVSTPGSIRIDIVDELPGELGGRAVGCYLPVNGQVLLLSYATFEASGEWFRVPVSPELYRAAAAHEVAHAAVGCHTAPQRLPVAAHEYLAYVVMFATLQPALRERVLARFPGRGFANTLQINDVNHIVDPNQYAVDAWRHYLRKPDPAAWLQAVLNGEVVQEWPREGP